MGLFDLGREVITEYKADTSDMKSKLRELDGIEREHAEVELETAKARNEHADQWLEKMAKVTLAIGAVKEIGEIAFEGYNEKIKEARLETAAYGIDIEKLGEAAGGLKTHMELLELAAKANKSAFHNSQEDMETAEKAMRALEARGVGAAEAQEAVTKALVEGKTRGLEPYGIVVNKHIEDLKQLGEENLTLAQKTEIHKNAMEQLKIVSEEVVDGQDNVGESMKRAEVKLSDAWAELKKSIGGLVEAMGPLINAFSWVIGHAGEIAKGVATVVSPLYQLAEAGVLDKLDETVGPGKYLNAWKYQGGGTAADAFAKNQQLLQQSNVVAQYGAGLQNLGYKFQDYYVNPDDIKVDEYKWSANKAADARAAKEAREVAIAMSRETGGPLASGLASGQIGGITVDDTLLHTKKLIPIFQHGRIVGYSGGDQDQQLAGTDTGDALNSGLVGSYNFTSARENANALEQATRGQRYQGYLDRQTEPLLEKTFGKVGEFDLYKRGFEALTGAVGNMYDAIISGQESATTAFKKFIAGSVAAVGKQMAIEAVKEGAYAIGNLAFGNLAGAAAHAEAAAEFAAGAVLAGVIANELGYGSSSGPSAGAKSTGGVSAGASSSGGGGGGSGGAGSSNAQRGPIIVIGDSFADDSPRNRQIKAQQLVERATGNGAVVNG